MRLGPEPSSNWMFFRTLRLAISTAATASENQRLTNRTFPSGRSCGESLLHACAAENCHAAWILAKAVEPRVLRQELDQWVVALDR